MTTHPPDDASRAPGDDDTIAYNDDATVASEPDATSRHEHLASAGHSLGAYVLRECIGSGGMGEVWRAEQTHPVRRTVALKVIKAGMDSRQILARFEAERQALALMNHPCIAKVFDAGTTPQGRPWFAMEYVEGTAITEYCDRRKLNTHERLELFQQVCAGVQHAHQKAVLHRDLKPSNILVSDVESKPLPKIIDFGVAKATTQRLTDKTMYTELGQLLGTPEYMSPEQAEMSSEGVDTRTDVYSLGVVLYRLLAGALPFESKALREAGFDGIRKMIREQDPQRPSTKVSLLGDKTTQIAEQRSTGPRRLTSQLRGDLDWITMRCLEKDRNRRYGSPAELSQDIQRHLDNQPVLAGPPSARYRVSKFVRRHRTGVAVATAAIVALLAFAVSTTVQSRAVARARDQARGEAAKAKAMNDFLTRTLASADPWASGKRDVTVVEALDAAADEAGSTFADQPAVEASMRSALGEAYLGLGRLESASAQVERALEIRTSRKDTTPLELAPLQLLASRVATLANDFDKAVGAAESAVHELESDPSVPLTDVVLARQSLTRSLLGAQRFAKADSVLNGTQLLAARLEGKDRIFVSGNMTLRASLFELRDGNAAAADSLSRAAYTYGLSVDPDSPHLAVYMDNAAHYRSRSGDFETALADFDLALELHERFFGVDHPEYATCLENRGGVLYQLGRPEETLETLERVYEIRARNLGPDHIDAIRTRLNIGTVAFLSGDDDRALATYRELEPRLIEARGTDHPDVLTLLRNKGLALRNLDRLDEALALFDRTLEMSRRMNGDDHVQTALALFDSGQTLMKLGRDDEARTRLTTAFDILLATSGAEYPRTVAAAKSLVELAEKKGDTQAVARYKRYAGQ